MALVYPLPSLKNDLLLRAINRMPVPHVPVWMMRQAGRADPEYRAYREHAGLPLFDLFRAAEHAIPITLLPQRFGVDALIIFQDILTPLEPMGAVFDFAPGPQLAEPIRTAAQVAALRHREPAGQLPFVGATIEGVLARLDGALPLLGFAGAPFTLAAFMIEGRSPGQAMPHTIALAREHPQVFGDLIERLTEMTAAYLSYQGTRGVHAVQLFESVGDQIPRDLYERFAQPSQQRIFAALPRDLPAILFVRESPFPELMLESGAAVLSVGRSVSLGGLLARGAGRIAVQGNVDNRLLVEGDGDAVEAAVRACIAEAGGPGHILNLNHGLLPDTPFENVLRFVRAAHETPAPGAAGAE
ncbi:MAG TPA: uroporphyrinogen decarboxylase family protein [bacterium]|nr:uroporphyrinogen decarboxylase family protein [bacterium]